MIKISSLLVGLSALVCTSFGVYAQDKLDIAQAIEMALAHDPRIEEKEAFVRKARGLLQEAEGGDGLRYSVDSFLALTSGVRWFLRGWRKLL